MRRARIGGTGEVRRLVSGSLDGRGRRRPLDLRGGEPGFKRALAFLDFDYGSTVGVARLYDAFAVLEVAGDHSYPVTHFDAADEAGHVSILVKHCRQSGETKKSRRS